MSDGAWWRGAATRGAGSSSRTRKLRDYYRRWPASVPELQAFAQQTSRLLDLSIFSNLSLRQVSPDTIHVAYIAIRPSREQGEFAISVRDVVGRGR